FQMSQNTHTRTNSRSSSQRSGASPKTLRFLYGGYAVLAIAAVVLSWHRAPGALLGVAAIVVVLATIVSLLTYALSKRHTLPAMACLWAVLGIAILSAALFLSS